MQALLLVSILLQSPQTMSPTTCPIKDVDLVTWKLVIEKASMIKKGADLDLSAVIAGLILSEINYEAPATLAPEITDLANNGKTGGMYDRELNKRLLGVYYKAKAEADARDKKEHDDLRAQIKQLQAQIDQLKKKAQ